MYPFERFTERAKKVLTLAQEEAERSHHSYIGTEHLLLGLLREGEGLAAKVLNNLGVEINKVRSTIESVLGRNERIIIQQIIPTSRVKKVIEISFEEARRMGNNYVGTEHLLLGLLIEGEGIAAHVLEDLGANLEKVRGEIERLLHELGVEEESKVVTLPVAMSGETISPSLIIPAKGATRLIRPNFSMAKSAIMEQSFSFVTSHTIVRTSAFISFNSASAGARRDSATSARSTFPPLPAQYLASASPIPPLPPVITATELVISNMPLSISK